MEVIYAENDNLVKIEGLRDGISGDYINNAAVQISLTDAAGNDIVGQAWPMDLTYVTGSNGDYFGVLSHNLSIGDSDTINGVIIADGGEGLYGKWQNKIRVSTRPF